MISIDGNSLTLDEVVRVARQRETVEISPAGRQQLAASRAIVDKLLDSAKPVYGISTGFGNLSQIWISPEEREALQRNLIPSLCRRGGRLSAGGRGADGDADAGQFAGQRLFPASGR